MVAGDESRDVFSNPSDGWSSTPGWPCASRKARTNFHDAAELTICARNYRSTRPHPRPALVTTSVVSACVVKSGVCLRCVHMLSNWILLFDRVASIPSPVNSLQAQNSTLCDPSTLPLCCLSTTECHCSIQLPDLCVQASNTRRCSMCAWHGTIILPGVPHVRATVRQRSMPTTLSYEAYAR